MKLMKKILVAALTAVLTLSCFSGVAFAADEQLTVDYAVIPMSGDCSETDVTFLTAGGEQVSIPQYAYKGDGITFRIALNPDKPYLRLTDVRYQIKDVEETVSVPNVEGFYSFVMPEKDVRIIAYIEEVLPSEETPDTGDGFNFSIYLVLMLVSAGALFFGLKRNRQ